MSSPLSKSLRLSENIALIDSVIAANAGDSEGFARILRKEQIPHLSFSQVTSVEFCQYQYYLQYCQVLEPDPVPTYFEKGKLLHEIIAASYGRVTKSEPIEVALYQEMIDRHFDGEHHLHLSNAIRLHLDHLWQDCEVIAVEKPFVMALEDGISPCVGVIDLILRQKDRIMIIDHKTGRDFYPQDVLQMAIYAEYIKRHYQAQEYEFFYDSYRWVKNLNRIRKPAFQRKQVRIPEGYWPQALERIRRGHEQINKIMTTKSAVKNGECFRCPYRSLCRG
jgi:hypothetical protein